MQNTFDYSPFGVSLDGRTVEGDFYRRGFNGMEKGDEVKGKGNSYTTEFRQMDPRVGRWFSIDPVTKPTFGLYNSMSNNPIIRIDPWGNDDYFNLAGVYLGSSTDGHTIRIVTSDVKLMKAIKNTLKHYSINQLKIMKT
ncbi:MAG: RHS repeat-associated core domain-containing protein [Bacteroidota bacterium]